jgi:uncharacterized membrane protein
MLTAIFITQCLILIFLFIGAFQFNKNNNQENENPSTNEITIFKEGLQRTWNIVNVSLYKMWKDLEILDFDSLQETLQKTLNELSDDPVKMEEWFKKFNDYIKEKQ